MDETTPLLARVQSIQEKDVNVVDFDPTGDPENPIEWPNVYKWVIVALLACMAFVTLVYMPIIVLPAS